MNSKLERNFEQSEKLCNKSLKMVYLSKLHFISLESLLNYYFNKILDNRQKYIKYIFRMSYHVYRDKKIFFVMVRATQNNREEKLGYPKIT